MKKITFSAVTVIAVLALFVSGCGTPAPVPTATPVAPEETPLPPAPTPTVSPEKTTLVVAFAGTVEQLDPNYSLGSPTAQTVVSNVYDQLTEYEKVMSGGGYLVDDMERCVGAVAESYEISADGMDITYHIREGLTFHDGTPLTAEAVKFMFDRIIESEGFAKTYCQLAGATTTDDFELVDDNSLVVHLEKPNILAMRVLTLQNITPVNPQLVRAHMTADDPFAQEWMSINEGGSGPFTLERWIPGSEVVLQRFDEYWKGPAALEKVIIKIIPTVADRILALEAGEVDMIMDVPPRDIARLDANPNIKMIAAPSRAMVSLHMVNTTPPFDSLKVRQAIAYAVPYETIVDEVYRGYADRLRGVDIWKGSPTYTEEFYTYETDLDRARALLVEAGYPDGFETSLVIKAGAEQDEEMAVWIKASLEQIGITVNIETMPMGGWVTKAKACELPMFITGRQSWVDDPFYAWFGYLVSYGPVNWSAYSNPEFDDLVSEHWTSPDVEARARASRRIQEILCEEVPLVPLVQPTYNVAMRPNVQGYHFGFDGTFVTRFYTMYKE